MRLDGQEGITHHDECHAYHPTCAKERVASLRKENAELKAALVQAQAALAMDEQELERRQGWITRALVELDDRQTKNEALAELNAGLVRILTRMGKV